MKRYFLGFLSAYLLAVLITAGMLFWALSRWFFSSTPTWFNILFLLVTLLPFLLLGIFLSRPTGMCPVRPNWKMFLMLCTGVTCLALLFDLLGEKAEVVRLLVLPGLMLGELALDALPVSNYWEAAFILAGDLLLPMLYHVGWLWKNKHKIVVCKRSEGGTSGLLFLSLYKDGSDESLRRLIQGENTKYKIGVSQMILP